MDRGAWEANSPWCCKESDTTEQLSTAQQIALEAQDLNIEQYTKVVEVVQNVIQCYHVIYDEKKRATTQTSLDHFSREQTLLNSARNHNLCHQCQV